MTSAYLPADIAADEGFRAEAYPDPLSGGSPWTIGYGHTGRDVHPGLTWNLAEARQALAADIGQALRGLDTAIPWWRGLVDARQDVLANMAFNLGAHGLLEFRDMLDFVRTGDFAHAAVAMLDSDWARQLVNRSHRLALQMQTGVRAPTPEDQP